MLERMTLLFFLSFFLFLIFSYFNHFIKVKLLMSPGGLELATSIVSEPRHSSRLSRPSEWTSFLQHIVASERYYAICLIVIITFFLFLFPCLAVLKSRYSKGQLRDVQLIIRKSCCVFQACGNLALVICMKIYDSMKNYVLSKLRLYKWKHVLALIYIL